MRLSKLVACMALLGSWGAFSAGASNAVAQAGPPVEDEYVEGELLVGFNPGVQQLVANQVIARHGCQVIGYYEQVRIFLLTTAPGMDVKQTERIFKAEPNVYGTSPNYIRRLDSHLTTPNDPAFSRQWGLNNTGRNLVGAPNPPPGGFTNTVGVIDADIDAPQAWEHTTNCSGEVVAIMDSGLDVTHPDFMGNFPAGNIWVNPGDPTANGVDNDNGGAGNGIVDDVNGANFSGYEMHAENVAVDGIFFTGEWVVVDLDSSLTITVGDLRITATAGGGAGTVVAAGDADIGTALIDFLSLELHAENVAANMRYDNGEWVIGDLDSSATITVGDVRLTATTGGAAGSAVVAGDADIGTALVPFVAVPNNNITDIHGHGTNVASVVGAFGNNNMDIAGVCWRVQLMAVKVARPGAPLPTVRISDEIAGINYVIALKTRPMNPVNVRIINFSAGGPGFSAMERAAIAAANTAGILFVTAAGNTPMDNDGGPETIYRDVAGPGGVSVGDVRLTGIVAGGVNYYPGSTVVAGDNDIGNGLAAFAANERHADPDASATYTNGEAIYQSAGAAVAVGDTRLTMVSSGGMQFGPGSVVAAGDPDIGTALIAFLANERHDELVPADGQMAPFFANTPCSYDLANIVCVAASENRDNLASFSAFGTTSVDMAAPGVDILMLRRTADMAGPTRYASGTSFAAPHVAGIAAHFWSLPGFGAHTIAQIKTRLMNGLNGPLGVAHPHGVDPRIGLRNTVVSGINNDGRARMTMGDDFGDAPDLPYPTRLNDADMWGARHEDIGEEWLGRSPDLVVCMAGMGDVSPEFDAFDNAAWPPDPDAVQNLTDMDAHDDGIDLIGPFVFSPPPPAPPNVAQVRVYIRTENNTVMDHDGGRYGGGGHGANDGVHGPTDDKYVWVNGFFDWNKDGDWNDADEHVFMLRADPSTWVPVTGGCFDISFDMPEAPVPFGPYDHWARFRLDYGENLGQALAAPANAVGPSPGGLVTLWNDAGGLPTAKGMYMPRRYESVMAGGPPDLDLKLGLAQFGEVEDYLPTVKKPAQPVAPGIDLWMTLGGGRTTTDEFTANPIPAGFFGPGSDPFFGSVSFAGQPLDIPQLGPVDTIVERLGPADFPQCGPDGEVPVPIEIRALSLVSENPIVVTYNGGLNPELWDLDVYLSDFPQQQGQMLIRAMCEDGGEYDSTLPVQSKFIFTRQSDNQTQIFDTGFEGLPPQEFHANGHFVYAPDPTFGVITAPPGVQVDGNGDGLLDPPILVGSSNFVPGIAPVPCNGGLDCKNPSQQQDKELTDEEAMLAKHGVLPGQESHPGCQTCPADTNSDNQRDGLDIPGFVECFITGIVDIDKCPCADMDSNLVFDTNDITEFVDTLLYLPQWPPPPPIRTVFAGHDLFVTDVGSFHDFSANPVPADFFFPGSAPVVDTVDLESDPLGTFDSFAVGDTDTVVERLDDAEFANVGDTVSVDVELVALSLRSVDPILVSGPGPNLWDVHVELSPTVPSTGTMDMTLDAADSGTYDATLNVTPQFVFSESGNPSNQLTLDAGAAGFPPISMTTINSPPWNQTPAPFHLVVPGLTGPNFYIKGPVQHSGPHPLVNPTPPLPPGACCIDGACVDALTQADCKSLGGVFQGPDTDCLTVNCEPTGACCVGPVCQEPETASSCSAQGGIYQGDSSTCASVNCGGGPPNDDCSGAEALTVPGSVLGSTVGAGPEVLPFCGTTDGSGGGVWYSVIGTGNELTATTCNAGTDYDTKLRVWTDGCATLTCVTGADDDPSCPFNTLQTTVSWCSVAGVEYLILVHGFSSFEGNFELSISDTGPCGPPQGACCFDPVTCIVTDQMDCKNQGGVYQGDGVLCSPLPCAGGETGACCFGPTCEDGHTQASCEKQLGIFFPGQTCFPGICDTGSGDCCFVHPTPGCQDLVCEQCVCTFLPQCCGVTWDQQCVEEATLFNCVGSCNCP